MFRYRLRTLLISRRWLRFSLRGMFILITVFGCWLGTKVSWLRQRRIAREWIEQHEIPAEWSKASPANVTIMEFGLPKHTDRSKDAPLGLRLLGESRLAYIILDKSRLSERDAGRLNSLQALFPEADGVHVQEPGWTHRWPPVDPIAYLKYPTRIVNGKMVNEPIASTSK